MLTVKQLVCVCIWEMASIWISISGASCICLYLEQSALRFTKHKVTVDGHGIPLPCKDSAGILKRGRDIDLGDSAEYVQSSKRRAVSVAGAQGCFSERGPRAASAPV